MDLCPRDLPLTAGDVQAEGESDSGPDREFSSSVRAADKERKSR